MPTLSPPVASRVAATCALGLVACLVLGLAACLVLGLAAWSSATEELEALVPVLVAMVFGVPVGLWLIILAALLAGRRRRVLGPARVSGAALGCLGALAGLASVGDPGWGTLACAGLAGFGAALYALAGREDLASSFEASDARARSRALSRHRSAGRRALTVFACLVGVALVYWMGSVVVAYSSASSSASSEPDPRFAAWSGPPATPVPPAALEIVATSVPARSRIIAIVAAEGYAEADVHSSDNDVVALPLSDPGPNLGSVLVYWNDPRALAYWRAQSGTTTGQYAFVTSGGCRFIAEPAPGLVVRAERPEGCVPFDNPRWDWARRIARRLAGG